MSIGEERLAGLRCFYAGTEDCQPGHAWGGIRDHWLFHLIHRGRGQVRMGGVDVLLGRGDGFLAPPDTEIYYRADVKEPWAYSWFACVGLEAHSCFEAAGVGPQSPYYRSREEWFYRPGGEFAGLVARLAGENDDFLQSMDLFSLFGALRRSLDTPRDGVIPSPASTATDLYSSLVQDYIRNTFSRPETRVEAWADRIGVSRKHLSDVIRKRFGRSPRALLTEYRLNRAGELLKSTALSIGAVAASVGYSDPMAFSRAFHRRFGLAPREWRAVPLVG